MKNKNNRKEGIGGLFKIIVFLICAASPLFCFAQEYVETTVMTFPNKQLKIERIEVVSPSKNSTWYMIDASCNDSLFTISSVGDPYYDKEGKKIIIGNTYTMSLYGHYLEQFEIDAGFDRFKWGSKKIIKKNHRDIVFLTDNLIGDRYVEHKEYKLNGNIQRPSEGMSGTNANGRQYVDLGLPSGTLWATCNIGANTPEECGLFFAWGDTKGHNRDYRFHNEMYKWSEGSGHAFVNKYTFADKRTYGCWYKDGIYVGTEVDGIVYKDLTTLLPEDDAATVIWGKEWCMPTADQISELCDKRNTVIKLVKVNGVLGYQVRSKKNKNSIFFPTRGHIQYLNDFPEEGLYWTCTLSPDDSSCANILLFSSKKGCLNSYLRFYGLMIRPVRVKESH